MRKGERCRNQNYSAIKEFRLPNKDLLTVEIGLRQCEMFCSLSENCSYCSIQCDSLCQWNALVSCEEKEIWQGFIEGDITIKPGKICNSQ